MGKNGKSIFQTEGMFSRNSVRDPGVIRRQVPCVLLKFTSYTLGATVAL